MFLLKIIEKAAAYTYSYADAVGKDDAKRVMASLLGYEPSPITATEIELELSLLDEHSPMYDEYERYTLPLMRVGAEEFGRQLCDFAVFFSFYPEVLTALGSAKTYLTVENALKFLDLKAHVTDNYLHYLSQFEKLSKILATDPAEAHLPFFKRSLAVDARFMDYICGKEGVHKAYTHIFSLSPDDVTAESDVHSEYVDNFTELFSRDEGFFHIVGTDNHELVYITTMAGQNCDLRFLTVDFLALYEECKDDEIVLWAMIRELILNSTALCLHNITLAEDVTGEMWQFLLTLIKNHIGNLVGAPICLLSDRTVQLGAHTAQVLHILEVPDYTRNERIELLEYYATRIGIEQIVDSTELANRYKLNRSQIKKAISMIKLLPNPDETSITAACNSVIPEPKQGSIKRLKPVYTLDQLKLPDGHRILLENIVDHVRHRYTVYDTWGMDKNYAYGKNVTALLVGPPGTGKTMAVHVMSNMLNLPLYSVNLSQVVDKYIGETEKRLEEIFTAAEQSNVILFFDEADSIFGKRSEVNDSKDKYANSEVSYILQRLEQFDGIVILATNLKRNIDDAFLRRMRYIVEFGQPTAKLRYEIWTSVFPDEIPLDSVDFNYLANHFELSGGAIKNIALNAAFLAASGSGEVGMREILLSVRNENVKIGKPMIASDFGMYSALMNDVF